MPRFTRALERTECTQHVYAGTRLIHWAAHGLRKLLRRERRRQIRRQQGEVIGRGHAVDLPEQRLRHAFAARRAHLSLRPVAVEVFVIGQRQKREAQPEIRVGEQRLD